MNVNSIDGAPLPFSDSASPSHAQTAQVRQLAQAVRTINGSSLIPSDRELTMSVDPKTKIPVIKVIDSQTREVLDQIPAQYILSVTAFLEAQAEEEKAANALAVNVSGVSASDPQKTKS